MPCTGALLPAGPRTISLRGIEGRPGEAIDLSKHGRPRYPAAFANVRYLSDVRSLYPLLLQPSAGRAHGRKDAQPVLIRAGPGTGKTWCINQLAYFLARGWRALPAAQRLPVTPPCTRTLAVALTLTFTRTRTLTFTLTLILPHPPSTSPPTIPTLT